MGQSTQGPLRSTHLALSALALILPAAARAGTTEVLEPVTPWHVDWTMTSCTLERGFGDKDAPQTLRFEKFSPGQRFQLVIAAKALRMVDQGDKPTVIYGTGKGDEGFRQTMERAAIGTGANGMPALFIASSDLYGDELGYAQTIEAKVTKIHLKVPGRMATFETGPLDKPFDAMRICMDDLVRSWGFDPEQQRRLKRGPVPTSQPNTWVNPKDYPREAIKERTQALLSVRLRVDEKGIPTGCLIQRSYSGELFNSLACESLLKNARFEPALDALGNPVASFFVTSINWIVR